MKKAFIFFLIFFGIYLLEPSHTLKTYAEMAGDELSEMFDGMEAVTPQTTLGNIRFGAHPRNTRLFFDLSELPDYEVIPHPKQKSIEVQFFDTKLNPRLENLSLSDNTIREVRINSDENQVNVVIYLKNWKNSFVYLPLTSPPRLALDIRNNVAMKTTIFQAKVKELEAEPEEIKFVEKNIDADKILNENKARLLYTEGMKLFAQLKITEAKEIFEKLIQKYPHYPFNDSTMYAYGLILASEAGTKLDPNKYFPEKFRAAYQTYTEMLIRFPDTPYRPDVYYTNARMLLELNLYAEAIAQLDLLIEDFPKNKYTARALGQKASVLLEKGYVDDAVKVINKLVSEYGDSTGTKEGAFSLADALFGMEEYLDAFDIYMEAIKHWPEYFKGNPSSIFNLAEIYYLNKDYEIAQDYYFRIVNLFPRNINGGKAMNRLAQIYARNKDYSGSLKVLLQAKEKFKDTPEGQESLIRIADLGVNGKFSEEEILFHNLPELKNPFKAYEDVMKNTTHEYIKEEAMFSTGVAFTESNQFQKAIAVLKELLKQYPTTKHKEELMQKIKKNFREIIDIYYQQDGFFTVLLTYYQNFENFLYDIDEPKIIVAIARSYGELGIYESAEHFLKKVEKLDVKDTFAPLILKTRLEIAMSQKKNKEAIRLADKFLKDYPDSPMKVNVLRNKGEVFNRMKLYEKATMAFLQAISIDKTSQDASKTADTLGDIFYATKKFPEAEGAYLQSISIFEKSMTDIEAKSDFLINEYQKVANILFLQKKFGEAIEANKLVLKKFPNFPASDISTFQIAESYYGLKQYDEAKKYYEEVINKYPNTTAASSAESNLKQMIWEEENKKLLTIKPKKKR